MLETIRSAVLTKNKLVRAVTHCGSKLRRTSSGPIDSAQLEELVGESSPSVAEFGATVQNEWANYYLRKLSSAMSTQVASAAVKRAQKRIFLLPVLAV